MRNGALTTGITTCSSRPVDIRGTQLVPETTRRLGGKVRETLPTQLKEASRTGQPKGLALRSASWEGFTFSWEGRAMAFRPKSAKAARVTGPTRGRWEEHTSELQ